MRKRVISAIVALVILVPILIIGGNIYNITVYVLGLLGCKEFLDIKTSKKEIPSFVTFISYIMISFLIVATESSNVAISVDLKVLSALFLVFLLPTILYHDRKKYSIVDAFYLIGGIFFLGTSFSLFIMLRKIGLEIVIYLFLITIITDTYAYIAGSLIGKKMKMVKDISPNKTLEGMIIGTIFGTFISTMFYHYVIDPSQSVCLIVFISVFLSIIGQLGDLVFSSIKRYYGKKDFSNLMPGHGGILDRFDSIIFVVHAFMFLIDIL